MRFFRGPLKSWTKGEGDSPVSEADIAANELLSWVIRAGRPKNQI